MSGKCLSCNEREAVLYHCADCDEHAACYGCITQCSFCRRNYMCWKCVQIHQCEYQRNASGAVMCAACRAEVHANEGKKKAA
jgi:hypothetical protein